MLPLRCHSGTQVVLLRLTARAFTEEDGAAITAALQSIPCTTSRQTAIRLVQASYLVSLQQLGYEQVPEKLPGQPGQTQKASLLPQPVH